MVSYKGDTVEGVTKALAGKNRRTARRRKDGDLKKDRKPRITSPTPPILYQGVTANEIATILARMEQIKNTALPSIDGKMLWCAANLVFYAGLKENEIPWLKVRNAFNQETDIVISPIRECGTNLKKPICLSNKVKEILKEYIQYLKADKPALDPNSALFPGYSIKQGGKKALTKDLKDVSLNLKELRRIGAGNHYWDLIRDGSDPGKATKETAIQFREEDGDLKKDGEPLSTFTTPSKSEIKKKLKKEQKEKEEQERAEEQGPKEHRVSMIEFRAHAKKREKEILEGRPRPSARSYEGMITKVGIDYVKVKSYPGKTFLVKETTKINKGNQQILLNDLKERMYVSVRYYMDLTEGYIAKTIKVL